MNQEKAASFLIEFANLPLLPIRALVLPNSPPWNRQMAKREWLRFQAKWAMFPYEDPGLGGKQALKHFWTWDPLFIQQHLREVWSGEVSGHKGAALVAFFLRLGERSEHRFTGEPTLQAPPIAVSWDTAEIVLIPSSPEEGLWLSLLHNSRRLAVCENPECPAPYFLRYRHDRFCSKSCARFAQREYKRRWWAKHGKAWRARRRKK